MGEANLRQWSIEDIFWLMRKESAAHKLRWSTDRCNPHGNKQARGFAGALPDIDDTTASDPLSRVDLSLEIHLRDEDEDAVQERTATPATVRRRSEFEEFLS